MWADVLEVIADYCQLGFVGLLLDLLLFEGTEAGGLVRLGVIAAVLIAVVKAHGWLVLLVLQVGLFIVEPNRPNMALGLLPWLYCLTAMCIVAYTQLGRPFRSRISKSLANQVLLATGLLSENNKAEIPEQPTSNRSILRSDWLSFFAIQFAVWIGVVLIAMIALRRLPISAAIRSEWLRAAIDNDFVVWPGATLLVLSLVLVIVFMESGWRQMTKAQASLYLRSVFIVEHYRDLRLIVVRRLKRDKKLLNALPQKQLVERDAGVLPKL